MKHIELSKITRPTIIVDIERLKSNIDRIYSKVTALNISFRPHFKTHQSKFIGNIFKEFGVDKITVSSLRMAEYFLQTNWRDILIAFPLNLRELDEILKLSSLINLSITVSDIFTLEYLDRLLTRPMKIFIEIDVDYHRSGIYYNDLLSIEKVIKVIKHSKHLKLIGILAHNGLTYSAKGREEVIDFHRTFLEKLVGLKNFFIKNGLPVIISVGDTPSVSICDEFPEVDELRPGNFVFYDVMQFHIGSCDINDISLCVVLPVVSINHKARKIICYGGSVSLSKEFIEIEGTKIFGLVVQIDETGWSKPFEDTFVSLLTQEHCVITTTDEVLRKYKPGDLIGILPIHSCLTADAMKLYFLPGVGYIDHL